MTITEGQPAPLFSLSDDRGNQVSMADLKGRWIVLYFYPRDNTPSCTKEACTFRDLWGDIEATGAVVLGVSPDSSESHEQFIREFSLPFSLLADPDHEVIEKYGAWGQRRKWYGRKVTGVIRSTVLIDPNGVIHKHWPRVDNAEEHPADVLKVLQQPH
ncbi:MAG: peroxiredoxin [Gammaproteobacteria bacterium]|nr:peroxiredoxin [Gammaproteobacteria bacterium]NNL45266.1 peroxiredoxin [Woeseiaceae bacterium]